mmetsp:Transcript_23988/g.43901  ORF Transcript_23988/g.43901 Transcript_23988/m.43901 type:complete len:747 (-) Transcript_23988:4116-6356(-)
MSTEDELAEQAQVLLSQGQTKEARALAQRALKINPTTARAHLALIDAMQSDGDLELARTCALEAIDALPANPWPRIRLARLLVLLGHPDEATKTLQQAILNCTRVPAVDFKLAELYQSQDQPLAALSALSAAAAVHEGSIHAQIRYAQALLEQNQQKKALVPLRVALALEPLNVVANKLYVRSLKQLGRDSDVLAHVQTALQMGVTLPSFFIEAARIAKDKSDVVQETNWLTQGMQALPRNAEIVNQLVNLSLKQLDHATLEQVARGVLTPAQIAYYQGEVDLRRADFAGVVQGLRARFRNPFTGLRDARCARQMAEALMWQNQHALARRYLRFCLRRWPQDWGIVSTFMHCFVRFHDIREAITLLRDIELANPGQQAVFQMRLSSLYCNQNMPDQAMACFDRARPMVLRNGMNNQELVRSLLSAGRWGDADRVIEAMHAAGGPGAQHMRSSLLGQIATEYELAHRFSPELLAPDITTMAAHMDNVLRFPKSTLAAMRLIYHWRYGEEWALIPAAATRDVSIPRQIVQYWHSPDLPDDIARMVGTWQAANGYEHTLYSREMARKLLHRDFGPKWVRAFQMANTATEEADFLRLCLVARYGGVYADADDILEGDLDGLLECGTGAVLHLAHFGGNVGNNFFAARAGHPLIVMAAQSVRQALLTRSNESVWQKAGPGLLTRMTAQYVARMVQDGKDVDVALIRPEHMQPTVFMHNETRQKRQGIHWNAARNVQCDYLSILQGGHSVVV